MSKLASPIKIVYWIDGVGGIWLEIRCFIGAMAPQSSYTFRTVYGTLVMEWAGNGHPLNKHHYL
jgi:hypothetical protein